MKSMLKTVIIGGTKNTVLTSVTKRAALFIMAIANLILLNKHKKTTASKPVKANTAYARYLKFFPSFSRSLSLSATPYIFFNDKIKMKYYLS